MAQCGEWRWMVTWRMFGAPRSLLGTQKKISLQSITGDRFGTEPVRD
jgi:hypothetical protein